MTHTGVHQMGGAGEPPLERGATQVLAGLRGALAGTNPYLRPPVLSEAERAEAQQTTTDDHICRLCLGIHKFPNGPGCPRIATFKLDGDGRLVEGSFFPGTEWANGRVVLVEDIHEDGTEEEAGDGDR